MVFLNKDINGKKFLTKILYKNSSCFLHILSGDKKKGNV